jgi:hypothetical protein
VTAGRQVVLDEKVGVGAKSRQARGFNLRRDAEIEVGVEVAGDGVDAYVVEEQEMTRFKAASEALFKGGEFRHFPAFHRPKTQGATVRGRLPAGTPRSREPVGISASTAEDPPDHRYFVHGQDEDGVRFGLELAAPYA